MFRNILTGSLIVVCSLILGCGGPAPGPSSRAPASSGEAAPAPKLESVASREDGPRVVVSQVEGGDGNAAFDLIGLQAKDLADLAKMPADDPAWRSLFAVYVGAGPIDPDKPAILGSYQATKEGVRFTPRFRLEKGVPYQAVFHASRLSKREGEKPVVVQYTIPKPPAAANTVVERVYPTTNQLPENHLKFYIYFSGPMQRGQVYEHIKLLDAAGKPIFAPFLELGEELWNPDSTRFTLLFDPGRIKKGLKPREDLGPPIEAGKTYTLVIDRQWNDLDGSPLKESFRKAFKVGAAIEQVVDIKSWKITPPAGDSTDPVVVRFAQPLDHALLNRAVWITDGSGERVPGTATVSAEETIWQFVPKGPWKAGGYRVVADTTLEDLAGNNMVRPFEVDVFHPIQKEIKTQTVSLDFTVAAK